MTSPPSGAERTLLSPARLEQQAFAASFCGKLGEAQFHGQASSILRPEFRAAHRFSLALNSATGDFDRANAAQRKLRKLEPGFVASQFVTDSEYPINLLRATPFYNSDKLLDLEENLQR